MALGEYSGSTALGIESIPDDQSCWIAILHSHWPMPGYLHCDTDTGIRRMFLFNVSICRNI